MALSTGSTTCTICQRGFYCPNPALEQPCPAGTYNNLTGLTRRTECQNCSLGFVALSKGSTDANACTVCQRGFYCPNPALEQPCPAGTHNNQTGQTKCQNCSVGSVALSTGSTKCTICQQGFYCPNPALEQPCPAGTHNNQTGQTKCQNCSVGSVALST